MENHGIPLQLNEQNNVFLIDWLTVVSHIDTVASLKSKLGLLGPDIPWEDSQVFRNGYPLQTSWNGITISYGADQEEFYSDPSKARSDMGICLNLSGQGCRTYEEYGAGDWLQLLSYIFASDKYNITRLDLAYDDHSGILDINRIKLDIMDQFYTSRSRWWKVEVGSEGCCCYIGSPQSDTRIRIYDKAAERGFDDGRHWIRCELQLRHKNAYVAAAEIFKIRHIGRVASGILMNYLTMRVPTQDSNKSRWPVADYWDNLIMDMERISLWISPGEPYNFSKTECWLRDQCGQALLTSMKLGTLPVLLKQIEQMYPELAPKYQRAIRDYELQKRRLWEDPDEETYYSVGSDC